MTDLELSAALAEVGNSHEAKITKINGKIMSWSERLLKYAGKAWCEACDGTGALERLDSGYMRRFRLRERDGCKRCGGNSSDVKGRGFHD